MAKRPDTRAVAVLSEHGLYRHATAELLRGHGIRVEECDGGTQVSPILKSRWLHAVLVDLDHAVADVRELIRSVREAASADVIPVGSPLRQAAAIDRSDQAGVETPNADAKTLVAAANGKRPRVSNELARQLRVWGKITPRQRDVMRWLATGLDNRGIGGHLRTGERAVKLHVSALLTVFGVDNRAQLALHAHGAGLRPGR